MRFFGLRPQNDILLAVLKPLAVTAEAVLFDLLLAVTAVVYLTGGDFFIRGPVRDLIGQKPWIHRLAIAAVILVMLFWGYWRSRLAVQGVLRPSYWISGIRRIRMRAGFYAFLLFLISWASGTALSWLRHDVFQSGFDMAIFTQSVWNTLHGNFLYSSIKGGICLLGDHFSPILAALAIPYAVWPDPKCLLLIQALAAASSVWPLFCIARERLKDETLTFLFVLAFVLYLPLRNAVRFEFHPELLAIPVLFWAYYFLIKGKGWISSLFLLLALSTKENAALVLAAFGLYAFCFVPGKKIYGLFWMIAAPLYLLAVIHVLIPRLSGEPYFYLSGNFGAWKDLGLAALLKHVLGPSSWVYLVKIFLPVGFLSFLSPPDFLLAIPALVQNLVARNAMTRSIFFQYTAFLIPFVFVSAASGAARLKQKPWLAVYLLACTLLMSGISDFYIYQSMRTQDGGHGQKVRNHLSRIPAQVSVRTHEFFAAHVANRRDLYIFENENPKEGRSPRAMRADCVVLDRALLGDLAGSVVAELKQRGYVLMLEDDGFMIFDLGGTP